MYKGFLFLIKNASLPISSEDTIASFIIGQNTLVLDLKTLDILVISSLYEK